MVSLLRCRRDCPRFCPVFCIMRSDWVLWFLIFSDIPTLFGHPGVGMSAYFVWVSTLLPHPFPAHWDYPDVLEGIKPSAVWESRRLLPRDSATPVVSGEAVVPRDINYFIRQTIEQASGRHRVVWLRAQLCWLGLRLNIQRCWGLSRFLVQPLALPLHRGSRAALLRRRLRTAGYRRHRQSACRQASSRLLPKTLTTLLLAFGQLTARCGSAWKTPCRVIAKMTATGSMHGVCNCTALDWGSWAPSQNRTFL